MMGALLLGLSSGCGQTGSAPTGTTDVTGVGVYTSTPQNLVDAICAVAAQCDGADSSACLSGILSQTNIPTALGLSAGFGTVQQMLNEYSNGLISQNVAYANQCLTDLQALSCSSAAVTGAYSSSAPSNWSNLANMIPTSSTSCGGVF